VNDFCFLSTSWKCCEVVFDFCSVVFVIYLSFLISWTGLLLDIFRVFYFNVKISIFVVLQTV